MGRNECGYKLWNSILFPDSDSRFLSVKLIYILDNECSKEGLCIKVKVNIAIVRPTMANRCDMWWLTEELPRRWQVVQKTIPDTEEKLWSSKRLGKLDKTKRYRRWLCCQHWFSTSERRAYECRGMLSGQNWLPVRRGSSRGMLTCRLTQYKMAGQLKALCGWAGGSESWIVVQTRIEQRRIKAFRGGGDLPSP